MEDITRRQFLFKGLRAVGAALLAGSFLENIVAAAETEQEEKKDAKADEKGNEKRNEKNYEVEVREKSFAYYGEAKSTYSCEEAGCVKVAEVFPEIPEYKKILEENIDKKSGKHWTLLRKANARFHDAVRKVAKANSLDFVAERDSLKVRYGNKVVNGKEAEEIKQKIDLTETLKAYFTEKS